MLKGKEKIEEALAEGAEWDRLPSSSALKKGALKQSLDICVS